MFAISDGSLERVGTTYISLVSEHCSGTRSISLPTRIYASMQNWKTSAVLSFLFVSWRCAVLLQSLLYDHCTLHQSYQAVRCLSACGMICARCVNHTVAPSMIHAHCVNHTQNRHGHRLNISMRSKSPIDAKQGRQGFLFSHAPAMTPTVGTSNQPLFFLLH